MKRTFHLNRYCTVELVHTLCSNKLPKQGDCTTDSNYQSLIRIQYDLPAEMRFTFDHEMSHLVEQHLEIGAKSETVANRAAHIYKHARRQLPFFNTALY